MGDVAAALQQEFAEAFEPNRPLAPLAYMKLGGPAEYFVTVRSASELVQAVSTARKFDLEWTILGGASNVIIADAGIKGVVIRNLAGKYEIDATHRTVVVESGMGLARLLMSLAQAGLGGLESLYGIPGTVGGAVYGNAGAHGVSVSDRLVRLEVLMPGGERVWQDAAWLGATYRRTALKAAKSPAESPVILQVELQLESTDPQQALKRIQEANRWRITHQPIGEPCCGSVFKNPVGRHDLTNPSESSAGYLLEHAGAKALAVGPIHPSELHANFIVHDGTATATQAKALIEAMRQRVREVYSVTLHEEIEYLGEWEGSRGTS